MLGTLTKYLKSIGCKLFEKYSLEFLNPWKSIFGTYKSIFVFEMDYLENYSMFEKSSLECLNIWKIIFGTNTGIFAFDMDYLERYSMKSVEIWYTFSTNCS